MKNLRVLRFLTAKAPVLFLMMALPSAALAGKVPEKIRTAVEQNFPGATITEVEKEQWQGKEVTEVELTAADGSRYELYISEDGRIIKSEQEDELPLIGGELTVGLGARVESEIYRDVDTEIDPIGFFRYTNGPFQLQAYEDISASYTVFNGGNYSVGVKGLLDIDSGYDPDDSDYLRGMDKLDTLYSVGIEFEWILGDWMAEVEVSQDISGEHDGQEVELSVGRSWYAGKFEIRPSVSATWLSESAVEYFYGVSEREARADRQAYSPGSSFELSGELMIMRQIFGDFKAVGMVEVTSYGDEITDSPLVDEDYSYEAILGLMYTF